MRSKYALAVLADALQIHSFHLQLSDGLTKEELFQTVKHLQELSPGNQMAGQLLYFDLAQSTTSWPSAWASLLQANRSHVQEKLFEQVPMLKQLPWDDVLKHHRTSMRSFLPRSTFDHQENQESKGSEMPRDDDDKDAEKEDADEEFGTSIVKIGTLNSFSVLDAKILDDSFDAYKLKVTDLDATFLAIVQSKLQAVVWSMYHSHIQSSSASEVAIDLAKKGHESVVVPKDLVTSSDFELMMAGTVSMYPNGNLGKDHYPLCSLFGVTFFVNGPRDFSSLDAVVPAWCAKAVSRNDLAFFDLKSHTEKVLLYMTDDTLHVKLASKVNPKFRSMMVLEDAFASLHLADRESFMMKPSLEDKDKVGYNKWYEAFEPLGRNVFAKGIEFDMRLLGCFLKLISLYLSGVWDFLSAAVIPVAVAVCVCVVAVVSCAFICLFVSSTQVGFHRCFARH